MISKPGIISVFYRIIVRGVTKVRSVTFILKWSLFLVMLTSDRFLSLFCLPLAINTERVVNLS